MNQEQLVQSFCEGQGDNIASPCRDSVKDSKRETRRICSMTTSVNITLDRTKQGLELIGRQLGKRSSDLIDLVNQYDVATDSESCIAAFDNLYQKADAGCDAIDENGTKQCLERASRI
jgi:hypothetical protein